MRLFRANPVDHETLRWTASAESGWKQWGIPLPVSEVRSSTRIIPTELILPFLSVPYPIAKSKPVSIKEFCEQLPIPTSSETPLVFYTFSSFKNNASHAPKIQIPHVKPIRQFNDVSSACDWSKDEVGCFVYVKTQLREYQDILQTAQCSTTIMQQHLKAKLLEFLCDIRAKLIHFRAIEELQNILEQIESNSNGQASMSIPTMNTNGAATPAGRSLTAGSDALAIGFSRISNTLGSADNSLSPGKSLWSLECSLLNILVSLSRRCFSSIRHLIRAAHSTKYA